MDMVWYIVVNSLVSYAGLLLICRIMGKKSIAQLEFLDYVVAISIGSIAAQMSIGTDKFNFEYLIAIGIYFLITILLNLIERKATILKVIIRGKPIILIEQGKLNYENLKKSKLDIEELLARCRFAGYFDLRDVWYAILEVNGDFSVLPSAKSTPATVDDVGGKIESPSLSCDLVIDGKIIFKALEQLNKDTSWLMDKLRLSSKKEIKKIALAFFDEQSNEVIVHKK